jgi:hypothetical protein
MVEGGLDRHDAGIGDEAMGRLEAINPAIGGGDADRAALVAAKAIGTSPAATTAALPEEEPPAE